MQLLALALYHQDNRQPFRVLRFRPGRLNILTGESETGKSGVLAIIDFCLGRTKPGLPDNPIDRTVGWYALLVEFQDGSRMVLARPRPAGETTNEAFVRSGDQSLSLPGAGELVANTNAAALRGEVSAHLGIEDFRFQPPAGTARYAFDVSVAQGALFCFQNQDEIAAAKTLFHRQTEDGIAQAIKDTLPYFLGAAGPEQALRQHRLGEARREVRAAQRKLDTARRQREALDTNGIALLRLAENEGLLSDVPAAPDADTVHDLLRQALSVAPLAPTNSDIGDRRQELNEERRTLRAQLQEFDAALATVDRWQRRSFDFTGELHLQVDRLKTLDLLGPEQDHDTGVCPMCTQRLEHRDPSVRDIVTLTNRLAEELEQAAGVQPVRQEHLRSLQAQRESLAERLKTNGVLLKELMASDENLVRLQEQHLRAAHLQGRIAQSLAHDRGPTTDVSQLRNALASAQDVVSILEEQTANDDIPAETERRLADIAALMTAWARRLKLGQSEEPNEAGISFNKLSLVIRRPEDRLPQERVGSNKNYVGYHLVAHLALHTYLRNHNRPVPSFLALDQPTQAFFPSKPRDASTVPDADWATVTEYFRLLHDVTELNKGKLQIIVCDHANLPDDWFQAALIDNWRPDEDGTRNALIPPHWLS
ncbi:DUF3732 domain-containing protein [Streptomyces sp. st170]|uniref:DUF3732 domain-containing protein n=1 Tax=Streptomyces sp. st170 TaxID=1828058 RepID=UPI000BEF2FF0|nr:DUF3732 domain-containing protein [Streptomyces sp. st170]